MSTTALAIFLAFYFVPVAVWLILIRYCHGLLKMDDFGGILKPENNGVLLLCVFFPVVNFVVSFAAALSCLLTAMCSFYEKLVGDRDPLKALGGFIRSLMKNKE